MTATPPNPWGSCFDAAAWILVGNDDLASARMCHGIGIANKPGEEGTAIAHAWIELDHPEHGRIAIDPIWLVAQHADRYRKTLQVEYAVTYGREEFLRLWAERNYPGPWDERVRALTVEGKAAALAGAGQHDALKPLRPRADKTCVLCPRPAPTLFAVRRLDRPTLQPPRAAGRHPKTESRVGESCPALGVSGVHSQLDSQPRPRHASKRLSRYELAPIRRTMGPDIFRAPAEAPMLDETRESAAGDLDEARGKITATREALERALEASDNDEIRAAIARLDRIEAELAAVERKVAGRPVKV